LPRDKTAADLLNRRLESLRLDPTSIDPAVMLLFELRQQATVRA
jgi:hypothetical protein